MKLRLCIPVLTVALASCGTTSSVNLGIRPVEVSTFQFSDARPVDDRMSSKTRSSTGESTVLGDDSIVPVPDQLVRAWLQDQLGAKLAGRRVQLTRFKVEIIDPDVKIDERAFGTATGTTPGSAAAAPIARPIILAIDSVKSRKTVLIAVVISLDDIELAEAYAAYYRGRVTEGNIDESIRQALKNLSQRLPA